MYAQQLNGWEELWRWISNTFKVEHKGKTLFPPPLPHVGICNGFRVSGHHKLWRFTYNCSSFSHPKVSKALWQDRVMIK